ncbi:MULTISPECIES: efflux transporter outer membrane subunit [unclassified Caballeronia]|uniref:efflux transporter outer membrane subunit n=1 Tax=unclassified Caballeronia TaxID=2646786 RepID=UPI00285EC899|nr:MULTISPECIES: efflux transporter outer membrane subunit [unclassified Caballeronia]MDR5754699.1 efflux transporter outer membrane subunit [Caballeronia sp. LZ024]MDR5839799.1 efflux transporter outer membrane subunit [Caballeronia sp. LZ031]
MRTLARIVLVIAPLALGGCLLGPNYEKPAIETPPSYRFASTEATQIVDTVWWEQFNDPALNDLIAVALAENKDVKIAAARVEQFLGQFQTTRSQLFPQAAAGFDAGRQRLPFGTVVPQGTGLVVNSFEATLSASWEIDVFGKLRRQTEAARANLLASEEGRRATILTLVSSVASTYIGLVSLDRQLDIAKATTASRADSVHVFTLRFNYGEVSQMELAQSQSEYEASLATIPQLEQQIAQQENALSVLLGRNPQPIMRDRELDDLAIPVVPAGLPSELLTRRPDLRQAEQNLIAANALIGAARALYFPSISLTGLFGTASGQFSSLFTGPARVWSYAGAVTLPIFTAGNIAGQVKQAEAQQQQALLEYQKAIQVAFQEVDDALVTLQKSRDALVVQGRQVDALRTYSRLARLRYEGGYTSYIEVLDAERSLFNAQLTYTQTQGTVFTSMVNLYKAMGGGWVSDAERMSATMYGANGGPVPTTREPPP